MSVPELRVHGVSGTPARNMLYTDPVDIPTISGVAPESGKYVRIYRGTRERDFGVGPRVRAFYWGGLTSGSWKTALWVLLLPFSLANLAGWASRQRSRWAIMWVRLFGLVLSGVFMHLAVIATADLFWQWSGKTSSEGWLVDHRQFAVGAIFMLLGVVWWALVSLASTKSHFSRVGWRRREALLWSWDIDKMLPPDRENGTQTERTWEDPAGLDVTDPAVWETHTILHRLRRLHFGFGFLTLAFTAAAASDTGLSFGGFDRFDIPTAITVLLLLWNVATLIATSLWRRDQSGDANNQSRVERGILLNTAFQPLVSVTVLVVAILAMMFTSVETGSAGNLGHLRDTSSVILGVGSLVILIVWITAGKVSASSSLLGAFFGLVMGAAAAFTLDQTLPAESSELPSMNWVSVAILTWLLIAVCVLVWTIANRIGPRDRAELWDAIHEATGDLSSLFIWLPGSAVGMGLFALFNRCRSAGFDDPIAACFQEGSLTELPPETATVVTGFALLAFALTVFLFLKARRRALALAIAVVVPLVYSFLRVRGFSIAGVEISLATVETTAQTFAVLLPASLLLGRMIGGIRGGEEARKGTGVIWDVVMLWPRWFHPLAPPAYGPHAVARLNKEIDRRVDPLQQGTNERPLIVAAHSQGTVITEIALAVRAEARRTGTKTFTLDRRAALEKIGLLTYGCPIDHLYNTYFPSAGFTPIAAAIADGLDVYSGAGRLSGRWANLHRPTDPIGGPLLHHIDVFVADPTTERNRMDPPPPTSEPGEPPTPPQTFYRIHSTYEPTAEFVDQRDRIESLL